ncbi:hypothetical protein Pmani_018290 [Petrolisthes manimaculis]|uniref:Uncharacterized protein n=1 Tax=Petrolisthes manimaculis TaxID=1843537 RepID=A0AAE1U8X1_9EUCA|nr:hypothetical protein Pmani_018290 [Petrolisthes manimaculis]
MTTLREYLVLVWLLVAVCGVCVSLPPSIHNTPTAGESTEESLQHEASHTGHNSDSSPSSPSSSSFNTHSKERQPSDTLGDETEHIPAAEGHTVGQPEEGRLLKRPRPSVSHALAIPTHLLEGLVDKTSNEHVSYSHVPLLLLNHKDKDKLKPGKTSLEHNYHSITHPSKPPGTHLDKLTHKDQLKDYLLSHLHGTIGADLLTPGHLLPVIDHLLSLSHGIEGENIHTHGHLKPLKDYLISLLHGTEADDVIDILDDIKHDKFGEKMTLQEYLDKSEEKEQGFKQSLEDKLTNYIMLAAKHWVAKKTMLHRVIDIVEQVKDKFKEYVKGVDKSSEEIYWTWSDYFQKFLNPHIKDEIFSYFGVTTPFRQEILYHWHKLMGKLLKHKKILHIEDEEEEEEDSCEENGEEEEEEEEEDNNKLKTPVTVIKFDPVGQTYKTAKWMLKSIFHHESMWDWLYETVINLQDFSLYREEKKLTEDRNRIGKYGGVGLVEAAKPKGWLWFAPGDLKKLALNWLAFFGIQALFLRAYVRKDYDDYSDDYEPYDMTMEESEEEHPYGMTMEESEEEHPYGMMMEESPENPYDMMMEEESPEKHHPYYMMMENSHEQQQQHPTYHHHVREKSEETHHPYFPRAKSEEMQPYPYFINDDDDDDDDHKYPFFNKGKKSNEKLPHFVEEDDEYLYYYFPHYQHNTEENEDHDHHSHSQEKNNYHQEDDDDDDDRTHYQQQQQQQQQHHFADNQQENSHQEETHYGQSHQQNDDDDDNQSYPSPTFNGGWNVQQQGTNYQVFHQQESHEYVRQVPNNNNNHHPPASTSSSSSYYSEREKRHHGGSQDGNGGEKTTTTGQELQRHEDKQSQNTNWEASSVGVEDQGYTTILNHRGGGGHGQGRRGAGETLRKNLSENSQPSHQLFFSWGQMVGSQTLLQDVYIRPWS